jgi:hypothetical protein
VQTTSLGDLVEEIRHQSDTFATNSARDTVVGNLRHLLYELDRMLPKNISKQMRQQLRDLEMFPVTMPNGQMELQAVESGEFWIPDIPVLHECFKMHAPLFEMDPESTSIKLENIISKLDMEDLLLTNAVQNKFESGNDTFREDGSLTQRLQSRLQYFEGSVQV